MKIEALARLLHAVPFAPFEIVLATGERLPVRHSDYVAMVPEQRVIAVGDDDGSFRIVNWTLVVSINLGKSAAA